MDSINDLQSLAALLTPQQVVTNRVALMTYERDASLDRGQPDAAVFVRSTTDVVKVVRWAGERGVPVVARGAGTGLSGGAVAERGGIILGFSRMNKIIEFDAAGRSVVVEPGVVNLVLDEFVKAQGLYYPPDPASGRTATTGGNIAENAGGPHCFKYGVTTNYITGLEVVLADGQVVRTGGRAFDYPELDLTGLLTGNEGTLGIITEASARLLRNTLAIKTALASFDSVEEAGEAVSAVIAAGLVPATMEMMDQKIMRILEDYAHAGLPVEAGAALIIEADGYPESVTPQMDEIAEILRRYGAREIRIAQTAEERDRIWYGRKSAAGAMARLAPAYYLVDGTVPRSQLAATLAEINAVVEANNFRVGYVFHAGDGNLHPFILIDDPRDEDLMRRILAVGHTVMKICVGKGGSVTGEHGVGSEKRQYMPLMYSADELDVMLEIKDVFDPRNLLNPGKVFPQELPQRVQRGAPEARPAMLAEPVNAEQAAEAIRGWTAEGKTIRIAGGGTKSKGLPPAEATLRTSGLCGLHDYALKDLFVTVGAGTPLDQLQAELARDKMWVPLVSPWPGSTVGGIVSASFNAPLRMRYGNIRDVVLAASVALADGRPIRAGRPVVKNVAGYDVAKLFVGSYGSLGLLTDVSLKLAPLPRARASLIVPFDMAAAAMKCGQQLLRVCLVASALLVCKGCNIEGVCAPYTLVYTAEGVAEDVKAELAQARAALEACNAPRPVEAPGFSGSEVWAAWTASATDLARTGAPVKELSALVGELAAQLGAAEWLADVASGILYTSGASLDALRRAAVTRDGYAVGLSGQADPWGYTPSALPLMRGLKARWDPHGLFNPGAFNL
jgi:D-lactate dehydrogenase (cytochrome)